MSEETIGDGPHWRYTYIYMRQLTSKLFNIKHKDWIGVGIHGCPKEQTDKKKLYDIPL